MNEAQVHALIAAGRLLQAKGWLGGRVKIERREGEAYPQAVSCVIATLDDGDRDHLRGLVAWVMDYEKAESRLPEANLTPADRRNKGGIP